MWEHFRLNIRATQFEYGVEYSHTSECLEAMHWYMFQKRPNANGTKNQQKLYFLDAVKLPKGRDSTTLEFVIL